MFEGGYRCTWCELSAQYTICYPCLTLNGITVESALSRRYRVLWAPMNLFQCLGYLDSVLFC
jgi:hypothetical protein